MTDPFAELGLPPTATADDVRAARRRLAKDHHPDAGGTTDDMVTLNRAAQDALRSVARGSPDPTGDPGVSVPASPTQTPDRTHTPGWHGHGRGTSGSVVSDVPSFTVEALPAEAFEALLIVASWIGEVLDDDPPYRLDVHLHEPTACWCRLDLVPDAGSATVSLTVGSIDGGAAPDVDDVRNTWIAHLNELDWS